MTEEMKNAVKEAYKKGLEDGAFLIERKEKKAMIRGYQGSDTRNAINAGIYDDHTLSNIYLQQHERD